MRIFVFLLVLVALSKSVSARTYDVCMSHCVAEKGFDTCNVLDSNCGDDGS